MKCVFCAMPQLVMALRADAPRYYVRQSSSACPTSLVCRILPPQDTAWHHMLAGMTIDINGYLANVTTLLPPPVNGSSSSTTSGSSTGASSTAGSSSGTAAAELPPVDSYALSRRVLMLVDFCYGCRPRVNLATLLLRSGRVFAMIVLIAPRKSHFDVGSSDGGSSSSSGGAEGQEAYECTEDLLALLAAAAAAGLEGYVGGFDGAPLQPAASSSGSGSAGAAAVAGAVAAALDAVAKSPVPLGFFFSAAAAGSSGLGSSGSGPESSLGSWGRLLPAPQLHVFMPLKGPAKYLESKMPVYCRVGGGGGWVGGWWWEGGSG